VEQEELYEEIDTSQSITERYLGLALWKFALLTFIVLGLGVYIGILLYGTNSLEILLGLDDYENFLHDEISRLKAENASLQKEYFELKELSAK